MLVPNKHPSIYHPYRLALIGEVPGKDEEACGRPFTGSSGRLLSSLLSKSGRSTEACFLGSICQHRPSDGEIASFSWTGIEIQHGLNKLAEDISLYNPNLVVLLGNVPLRVAKDPMNDKPISKSSPRFKASQWRGSLFLSDPLSVFGERKCLSSYNPAYALRDREVIPLLHFDLAKAVNECKTPTLTLPTRELLTSLTPTQIHEKLTLIQQTRPTIALDIEGYVSDMSCISIATAPDHAFIIPFIQRSGGRCFLPADERSLLRHLALVLEDDKIPKVLQNALYDRFVLHYSYGIRVRGVTDDTMLKHWEVYAELEKNLGLQASLYTDEPYYKGERKTQDDETFYRYCCKDSAITLEIAGKIDGYTGWSRPHYKTNVELLNPLLYMELRGIRYNVAGAKNRREALLARLYQLQATLNALSGCCFTWKTKQEIFTAAVELMGFKRAAYSTWDQLIGNVKKPYIEAAARLLDLIALPSPTLATLGEIESLCERSLNVDSPKQIQSYLYESLNLPVQTKENTKGEVVPTTDYEALIKLRRLIPPTDPRQEIITLLIDIGSLGTRAQMLSIGADGDQRIRCGYNIVGSNTGRITCYESPTGSGYNLQTIPNYTDVKTAPGEVLGDRDLFVADDDQWFFQCDLAGADGWTVAAYSAMFGDKTLLDDYLYGLKPARNLAIMLRGYEVDWSDRACLKEAGKKVGKDDWDYFAGKRVQHGASYLEGGITISRNIFKDSEGKLHLSPGECSKLRDWFFKRYWGILKWHAWIAGQLRQRPILVAASGQVRRFFGQPDETLTKAVAFEPQANTTYATNLAMHRLWHDPWNRLPDGRLKIEPLHQVHDALCGQFPKSLTPDACPRIKSYFDNPLTIAGQQITIPYEGGYGPSWGQLDAGKL